MTALVEGKEQTLASQTFPNSSLTINTHYYKSATDISAKFTWASVKCTACNNSFIYFFVCHFTDFTFFLLIYNPLTKTHLYQSDIATDFRVWGSKRRDQKPHKFERWYYSAAHWHLVNVMVQNIIVFIFVFFGQLLATCRRQNEVYKLQIFFYIYMFKYQAAASVATRSLFKCC